MIDRDKAAALAHCFTMMYQAERRGRGHEFDLWRLAALALIGADTKLAA